MITFEVYKSCWGNVFYVRRGMLSPVPHIVAGYKLPYIIRVKMKAGVSDGW